MTAVKSSVTDAAAVNAEVSGDFRDRKTVTSVNVTKEIDPDLESNASSSEDVETYSPKSVVVKKFPVTMTMKEISVSRARVHDPIMRIRAEDRQIGEDVAGGLISKFGNDRVEVVMFSRPTSPLGGKTTEIGGER